MWRSDVGPAAHRQRVLPDGCVEPVFSRERAPLVYGPRTDWLDVELDAGTTYEGIRLRPGTARAVLGTDLGELTDQVVELRDVTGWPLEATSGRSLRETVERSLARPADAVVGRAVAALLARPSLDVGEIARRAGIGERQLRRRFACEVGLTPSALRRSSRVDAALRLALSHPDWSWAAIAYELGFADQAHLSRDVVRCTGRPPSHLLPRSARSSPAA